MIKTIYGLIGKKLGHSYSADFFNKKFAEEDIPAEYKLFEMENLDGLLEFLYVRPWIHGLNVTIPFKEDAMKYVVPTDEAKEIGAINTIYIEYDIWGYQHLTGTNTDAPAFMESVREGAEGKDKALVLGSGGASKAVIWALKKLGKEVCVVSRSKDKGDITYDELTPEIVAEHLLIVNTTPLGMYPNIDTAPSLPYDALTPEHYCFDLVYNPEETLFMRKAAEHGAKTRNGLDMLHRQALIAWDYWQQMEHRR